MSLIPGYTVTWPTRPGGERTVLIRWARSPEAAVRRAASPRWRRHLELTTTPGHTIDLAVEPEVWRVGYGRARHVTGPRYPETAPAPVDIADVIRGLRTFADDLEAGDALAVDLLADGELPPDGKEYAAYPASPYRGETFVNPSHRA